MTTRSSRKENVQAKDPSVTGQKRSRQFQKLKGKQEGRAKTRKGAAGENETLRVAEAGKRAEGGGVEQEASRHPSLSRHTKARRLTCFGPLFKRFSTQAPLHGLSPARLDIDPLWDFLPKDSGLSPQDLEKAERRHSRSLSQPEHSTNRRREGGELEEGRRGVGRSWSWRRTRGTGGE